jgi:hypothetical protein
MGLWDPGGYHCHTRCLSSSVLKIDLFSMAFLELQWLVRPSAISRSHPSSQLYSPAQQAFPHRWPRGYRTTRWRLATLFLQILERVCFSCMSA